MKYTNKILLSTACVVSLLTGCNSNNNDNSQNQQTSETHNPVTISYAAWNLGAKDAETPNLDRLMIEEFQKEVDARWQELLDLEEITNR